ncbi:Glutamate synthase [NADH], amyloplastic [Glycine soja]|uniref:Glutamate synthase [NADH], amyloplastic n=1 Tax=Glycine soja TaxID=3848 RepID=A0A445F1D3_GLYSO|nr:Glutamate synthase [NADH], amyloplastic [Glycine soja]
MGFLLKEALRTLFSRNRWSYAIFWKIGYNNSKGCFVFVLFELYDPAMDKDSYGVGFVAELSGESSCKTVTNALEMPVRMTHRGACGVKPTLEMEQGSWWLYLTSFTKSEIASPSRDTKVFPMTSTLGSPLGILQLPSMARRISLIGEINDTKDTWRLAIRITKICFIQKTAGEGFLEMILMDEKGHKIKDTVNVLNLTDGKINSKRGKLILFRTLR